VGATYIRHQVLVQEIASSHESAMNIFHDEAAPFGDADTGDSEVSALFGDAGADDAKEDLSALFGAESEAEKSVPVSVEDETNQKGGDATFMILGLLFVFIQILGIFFGMHYDFAGRESKEAYACLRGFSTKKAFLSYYERAKTHIARIAQETTQLLRNNKDRTFKNYLAFEDK